MSMTGRTRCSQACEECKRRKERCDGKFPCMLCVRRGRIEACHYIQSQSQAHNGPRVQKRRRSTTVTTTTTITNVNAAAAVVGGRDHSHDSVSVVSVATRSTPHAAVGRQHVFTGESGTLTFLRAVGACVEDAVPSHTFAAGSRNQYLVEDMPPIPCSHAMLSISDEDRNELAHFYLSSTTGIFDMFDSGEVLEAVMCWDYSSVEEATCSLGDATTRLILAIGAQGRGGVGGSELGEQLFLDAQKVAMRHMLEPSTLPFVQVSTLLALYLFLVCRRTVAYTHLGIAIRAAENIGLHQFDVISSLPEKDQLKNLRAWKCLRILDLSSCASLGRTLGTHSSADGDFSMQASFSRIEHGALAAQIDSAGMQLCNIAETILVQVYEVDSLTTQLAYQISQELRAWTHHLPDILVPGTGREIDLDAKMPEALCLNALTGAYYWTIQLLTRPFLLAAARSKQQQQQQQNTASVQSGPNPDHQPFIDACINSAFRCLDVTIKLTQYQSLPKRLFLANNTTLASALVLGLAFFGDYDQHFPLESGLHKALIFLRHMEVDVQAQHYATIVSDLLDAGKCYVEKRSKEKLESRSVEVEMIFGSVHEKHEGRSSHENHSKEELSSSSSLWSVVPDEHRGSSGGAFNTGDCIGAFCGWQFDGDGVST